ncbi:MAG TPA: CPBP family intramembrane glutamic endopeptidase [Phenylobacterium sp.]|jgi:membrane protease YdiL (CAAX protease family)|nr:CPBP family intramembrane glutamic endopeptidase [Phenylobacterium sp.]
MTRPVTLPIVAFALVSAVASPLLARVQEAVALDLNIIRLTVFSTAVGALGVWAMWRKRLPYPPVMKSGFDDSLFLALAACVAAAGIALGLARLQGAPWGPPKPGSLGAPLALVLVVQTVGAAAEEVGWRGLVQPLLETKVAPVIASLVTGALFGLGHFYLAFGVAPLSFGLFLISAMAMSMILALATVGRSIRERILIATLLHFLLNMATLFLFADGDGSVLYFADLALAFGVCCAVASIPLMQRKAAASAIGRAGA